MMCQLFDAYGLYISHTHAPHIAGISGNGKGQGQLQLTPGLKYYASVRAVTGAGQVLESSSDGFVVDTSPPTVTIVSVGAETVNETTVFYQKEMDSYTAAWSTGDTESGVDDVTLRLGTYPGM